jgi:hypothetical protein
VLRGGNFDVLLHMIVFDMEGANCAIFKCGITNLVNCVFRSKKDTQIEKNGVVWMNWKDLIYMKVKMDSDIYATEYVIFNCEAEEKTLEQKYRSLMKRTNYSIRSDEPEIDIAVGNLVLLLTEGERRVLSYEILSTESGGKSHYGLGYFILLINNNQTVQGDGTRCKKLFASFIREEDLEAGVSTDFVLRVLMKGIQVELPKMVSSNLDEENFASDICENVCYLEEKLSYKVVFNWLNPNGFRRLRKVICICLFGVSFIVFETLRRTAKENLRRGEILITVSGDNCSIGNIQMKGFIIMWKKELRFRKGRLINKRNMISINQLVEQSTNNLILVSTTSRRFSKSSMFYYIDQRQEHTVSEVSSSSEDG